MLDVRRLRPLAEVARRGSIAAAADALRFGSSAVSQGACRATGFEPRVGFELDDYQTMQTVVGEGAGAPLVHDLVGAAARSRARAVRSAAAVGSL